MDENLSHWLLEDQYDVNTAALLLAGIDPYTVEGKVTVARARRLPLAPKATFFHRLITDEVGKKEGCFNRITCFENEPDLMDNPIGIYLYYECFSVSKDELLAFAARKGLDFPYGCPVFQETNKNNQFDSLIDEIIPPDHPHRPENLVEAIKAWKELSETYLFEDRKGASGQAEELVRKKHSGWSKRRIQAVARTINWEDSSETDTVLSPEIPVTLKKNNAEKVA